MMIVYAHAAVVYLGVCTVCEAQILYDGIYSAVFIRGGVVLWVESQIGTEQQVFPHTKSSH